MMFAEIAPNIILPSCFMPRLLIVIRKWFKEGLRMLARWAEFRSSACLDNISTVATLPYYLAITSKEVAISEPTQKLKIATFVLLLDLSNVLKGKGYLLKALGVCSLCK